MKQYFYDEVTVKQNHIASYADVIFREDGLYFVNTLTDRQVRVIGDKEQLEKLAFSLQAGISDDSLICSFRKLNSEKLLNVLFREGMIE